MMKPNTKLVFNYLKEINGKENVTAADVAEALGLDKRQVDGAFTSAIQKKGYGERKEVEVELEDGTHAKIKLLVLNAAGLAVDLDAE